MPTSIAEFRGVSWLRAAGSADGFHVPQEPAVAVTILSSAGSTSSNSTVALSAVTRLVAISGQQTFFALFGTSSFSTSQSTVSSTSAQAFPGGIVHYRGVTPSMKIIGWTS